MTCCVPQLVQRCDSTTNDVFYHFKLFHPFFPTSCLTVVFLAYVKKTWRVAAHGPVPSALWPPGISEMFLLGGQRQTDGRWAWSHFPSTPGASSPVSPALSKVPAASCADTVELFCFEPTTVLLLAVGDVALEGRHTGALKSSGLNRIPSQYKTTTEYTIISNKYRP